MPFWWQCQSEVWINPITHFRISNVKVVSIFDQNQNWKQMKNPRKTQWLSKQISLNLQLSNKFFNQLVNSSFAGEKLPRLILRNHSNSIHSDSEYLKISCNIRSILLLVTWTKKKRHRQKSPTWLQWDKFTREDHAWSFVATRSLSLSLNWGLICERLKKKTPTGNLIQLLSALKSGKRTELCDSLVWACFQFSLSMWFPLDDNYWSWISHVVDDVR
jgi:hypothetical protein